MYYQFLILVTLPILKNVFKTNGIYTLHSIYSLLYSDNMFSKIQCVLLLNKYLLQTDHIP